MKLYISIQREPRKGDPRGSARQRLRAAIRTSPQGHISFLSARQSGSVAAATRAVEEAFGPLHWSEANKAVVDLHRTGTPTPQE
jgi:hypothetical protein